MRTLNFCLQFVFCVDVHSHNDGGRAERPSVLSMSSSRSRKNRSSTSPEPASAPARSPLSLSKSRDGGPATSDSDDDGHHPRRHSRIDADEPRQGPSAPTTQRKGDNDDVAAVALPFSLSLTLKNTGSVARDHLASERTFLAYVRTSLSFASAGVGASFLALPVFISSFLLFFFFQIPLVHLALVQLFRVSVSTSSSGGGIAVGSYARPLGATTIAFGIAVLATGEYVAPFSLPYLPFLDTMHIAAQADALTGWSSQVRSDISPSNARCHRDYSLPHV